MNLNKRVTGEIFQYAIILFFIIFSIKSFGQKLIPYQISEDVSVEIPQEFNVIDTLGNTVIRTSLEGEGILIMKPNKKTDAYIDKKDELLKFYQGFQKGMLDQSKGQLISEEFVQINGFYFYKSSFRIQIGGTDKIWNSYTLLLNKISYSFIMINSPENSREVVFFNKNIIYSIKFRKDLTVENQMNTNEEDSLAYRIGRLTGTFSIYALIGGIFLFFILRKRRK